MSKHYQESEIEFRSVAMDDGYPSTRGIVVYQYGDTIEACIAKARKELNLSEDEWELVSTTKAEL